MEGRIVSSELQTREQLFEVMEQIAEEREAAWPVVQELLARTPEELQDVEIQESWRTAGFIQELTEAARKIGHSDPSRALVLQQLVAVVAMSIPCARYSSPVVSRLEGVAWRDICSIHMIQNNYDAAVHAADLAERSFGRDDVLAHDALRTKLFRAYLLAYSRRFDGALPLIEEVVSSFREFGDREFVARAEFARAMLEQQSGNFSAARDLYERILPVIRDANSLDVLGPLQHDLAIVYKELGQIPQALSSLEFARRIYEEIDIPVEKLDWILAQILMSNHDFVKALPILYRIRAVFLERKMRQDAGEVALDIVEVLIATDRYTEARTLTEQVVKEFVEAGLNEGAIIALAYLRDLLPAKKEARRAVQHVRSHLQDLRSEPSLVFLPLDEEPR